MLDALTIIAEIKKGIDEDAAQRFSLHDSPNVRLALAEYLPTTSPTLTALTKDSNMLIADLASYRLKRSYH